MAQNTVLSAGTSATNSSDTTVATGAVVTVGMFVASGLIPAECEMDVLVDTPGADLVAAVLTRANPVTVMSGPCTFRVYRRNVGRDGTSVGVFTET